MKIIPKYIKFYRYLIRFPLCIKYMVNIFSRKLYSFKDSPDWMVQEIYWECKNLDYSKERVEMIEAINQASEEWLLRKRKRNRNRL